MTTTTASSGEPVTAYIALGANLGDREKNIRAALAQLSASAGISAIRLSSIREFAAVGGPEGSGPFLNAVAEVATTLEPEDLLARMLEVEATLGRVRREKWGPRTIDLDLLLYGDRAIDGPKLKVPHPRMQVRPFVQVPLAELRGSR